MTNSEILNQFNNEGIFPSDSQLQTIAESGEMGNSILDVELNLLDVASSDVNHPYHSMTQPIPESEMSESQKEFFQYLESLELQAQ